VSALRKAVIQSDPVPLENMPPGSGRLPTDTPEERRHCVFYADDGGYSASDDRNTRLSETYFLGIIDILTPYNYVKKVEHAWKSLSQDAHAISAVPAVPYGDRFLAFMRTALQIDDSNKYLLGNAGLATFIPDLKADSHGSLIRNENEPETSQSREDTPASLERDSASPQQTLPERLLKTLSNGADPSATRISQTEVSDLPKKKRTISSPGVRISVGDEKTLI